MTRNTTPNIDSTEKKAYAGIAAAFLAMIAIVAGVSAYGSAASTKVNEALDGNSGDVAEVGNLWDDVEGDDTATPDDEVAADATPAPRDPYEGMPRQDTETGDIYDSYADSSNKKPTSAEVAAVATERGVLLHQWELGFTEQRDQMMKSYGVYDYDEYTDNKWLSWPRPTTGMTILMVNPDTGKSRKCTVGGYVSNSAGTFAITAGHCAQGDFRDVYYKLSNEPNVRPFGVVDQWQVMGKPGPNDLYEFGTDVAIIELRPDVADKIDPRIATELTIESVMRPEDITPGMKVCKMGYRSQESCGFVIASNDSEVRTHLFSLSGDSGSVLYTYTDKPNRKVAVIGVLSSSPTTGGQTHDFITDFALIHPVISRDNMTYLI